MHGKASWKNACTYHRPWFAHPGFASPKDAVRSEFSPIHTTKQVDDRSSIQLILPDYGNYEIRLRPLERPCFFFTWTIPRFIWAAMWPPWWVISLLYFVPGTGVVVEMMERIGGPANALSDSQAENGGSLASSRKLSVSSWPIIIISWKNGTQKLNWTGHWVHGPGTDIFFKVKDLRNLHYGICWNTSLSHAYLGHHFIFFGRPLIIWPAKQKESRRRGMRLFPDLNSKKNYYVNGRKCQLGWPIITWSLLKLFGRKRLRMISSVKSLYAPI